MSSLSVSLLGKFTVLREDQIMGGFDNGKVQELFSYLLLHRERPHTRESLAALLWRDVGRKRSKRYLRKTLWQLQKPLDQLVQESPAPDFLLVDPQWIQLNEAAGLWLDVALLERAFASCKGIPGQRLRRKQAALLQQAASLYRGDLLEGWYQDWCLYERERLQRMYLIILDKLVDYCVVNGRYEEGLAFSIGILGYDGAHERTHRHLMRLHYLAGDRTKALRQYEACAAILQRELGITPSRRTRALYQQIQSDRLIVPSSPHQTALSPDSTFSETPPSYEVLRCLKQIQTELSQLQQVVQQQIEAVETLFQDQDR